MSTLKTPGGLPAGKMDRIMLLSRWARHLSQTRSMLYAGMGKPTLPINSNAARKASVAWANIADKAADAHDYFERNENTPQTRDTVATMAKDGAVIDYCDPQGDPGARKIMADALTQWYKGGNITVKPEHILFTVGGAGAINTVFSVINDLNPNSYIVTPFPHYSLHATSDERTKLHPINVMKESGYRLTKKALEASIFSARKKNRKIGAFLFCDPNNPLGTVVTKEEWLEIAVVLREHPETPIILDEAYGEMSLDPLKPYASLFEVAPDLQDRIILMRSATKALSAAGERMAIAVSSNNDLMQRLVTKNISTVGHAPFINQGVFAKVLDTFGPKNRVELANFYGPQVALAATRLKAMGAYMPDESYRVDGTFYILANLEDLKDIDIPEELEAALGKKGKLETDEDVAYFLLFKGLMVAPLSYFGTDPHQGCYMRITCSGGDGEINKICDLLEDQLTLARKTKKSMLEQQITQSKQFLSRKDTITLEARYHLLKTNPSNPSPTLSSSGKLAFVPSIPGSDHFKLTTAVTSSKRQDSPPPRGGTSTPPNLEEKVHTSEARRSSVINSSMPVTPRYALQLKNFIDTQKKYLHDVQTIHNETQKAAATRQKEEALEQFVSKPPEEEKEAKSSKTKASTKTPDPEKLEGQKKSKDQKKTQIREAIPKIEKHVKAFLFGKRLKKALPSFNTLFAQWAKPPVIHAKRVAEVTKWTPAERVSDERWLRFLNNHPVQSAASAEDVQSPPALGLYRNRSNNS